MHSDLLDPRLLKVSTPLTLASEDEVFVENLRKEMHCKELSDERFEAVIDRLEKKVHDSLE